MIGWIGRLGRPSRMGVAFLAGALMTAGHPPIGVPWVLFAAFPMIALLVRGAPTTWTAIWTGWAAGAGYFITGLHWIGHAFLVDPDRFAWLLPLGVVAMPSAIAIFWALAAMLSRKFGPRALTSSVVSFAAYLSAMEVLRSYILTGFPWALPGYIWVDLPPMQAGAWLGPFGLTFLTLVVTGVPLVAILARRAVPAVLALWVGAGIFFGGVTRVPGEIVYHDDAPVLRLVQPNAPQRLKWVTGYREEFYERLLSATARPADPEIGKPDLVIWPEASVYFPLAKHPEEARRIAEAANGAPVLVGSLHTEVHDGVDIWWNAMLTVMPGGRFGPQYNKHHLVPFGEYLPFEPVMEALGLAQFANRGGFAAGPGPQTLDIGSLPSVSPLICYEAIFPYEVVGAERPKWMVQLTNDGWFGDFAGPQQHYAQARFRAVEQGLPLIRAANTGISAIVDPYGREVVSIELHNYDHIDAKLPAEIEPTLYSRFGDWPAFFLIAITLFLGFFLAIIQRTD